MDRPLDFGREEQKRWGESTDSREDDGHKQHVKPRRKPKGSIPLAQDERMRPFRDRVFAMSDRVTLRQSIYHAIEDLLALGYTREMIEQILEGYPAEDFAHFSERVLPKLSRPTEDSP